MKAENKLAMVVALYLSKFGEPGLAQLGFPTYRQAFEKVATVLGVKPNSVRNWRDEFDPYYDSGRRGWYQRPMRPSRLEVMATLDNLSEVALRAVVLDIIRSPAPSLVQEGLRLVLSEGNAPKNKAKTEIQYVARGPTGRMAEEFFVSRFRAGETPFRGELRDRRDDGMGFDFEIVAPGSRQLVEVKGMAKELGGIAFTDKEWKVANEVQSEYYLGLVTQIPTAPQIGFLQNPASTFIPAYHAYPTIAVSWTISTEQLRAISFT